MSDEARIIFSTVLSHGTEWFSELCRTEKQGGQLLPQSSQWQRPLLPSGPDLQFLGLQANETQLAHNFVAFVISAETLNKIKVVLELHQ
jgi:hypothetical protein